MQLGLQVGGLALFLATILFVVTVAIVVADIVMIVQLLRRRARVPFAVLIASIGIFAAEGYLFVLLWPHDLDEPWVSEFFFAPVVAGLIVLFIAVGRARTWMNAGLLALSIVLAAPIFVMWRSLTLRVAVDHAVRYDDTGTATRLIRGGALRGKVDAELRNKLLLDAATLVNPDIVKAFLENGADPNVVIKNASGLTNAIESYVQGRYPPIAPEIHPKRRFQTVEVLLDHGADPNLLVNGESPAEIAWSRGLFDIVALLGRKGARDATAIPAQFEELLRASANGDLQRVEKLTAGRAGKHQQDEQGRAPLIEAARNGHTEVVDALLKTYGPNPRCGPVERARDAAAKENHADTVRHLNIKCSPFY